jgi:EYA(Eyes Absent) family protein
MEKSDCSSSAGGPVSAEKVRTVYVWDMDETLILLKSLLDGTYANSFHGGKDLKKSVEIGKKWENLILRVCDDLFYYEEIENYNEPYLNSLSMFDDGKDLSKYDFENDSLSSPNDISNKKKLAYRHRSIADKYKKGLQNLLDEQLINAWNDLYSLTDSFTDGWLSAAHELVRQACGVISTGDDTACNNDSMSLIVTSGSLIPSIAKCLLYKLDDVISHDNIYSSWEVGKMQCFTWIKDQYNSPQTCFCVIGDGWEECKAAQSLKWPFIKVDYRPGNPNRFPGLNKGTLRSYISVMYGTSQSDEEEKQDG